MVAVAVAMAAVAAALAMLAVKLAELVAMQAAAAAVELAAAAVAVSRYVLRNQGNHARSRNLNTLILDLHHCTIHLKNNRNNRSGIS